MAKSQTDLSLKGRTVLTLKKLYEKVSTQHAIPSYAFKTLSFSYIKESYFISSKLDDLVQ